MVAGTGVVSMSDVDGDGLEDVVAVDEDRGRVYILRGTAGGVTPPLLLHTDREIHGPAAIGDVNGDGVLELVTGSTDGAVVHTARWTPATDRLVQGRRGAVIGTGASAIQLVPGIVACGQRR